MSKQMTLNDILPCVENKKSRGNDQWYGACPICEAGDAHGHHLYMRQSGEKLLMYCQHCNASFNELLKAFEGLGATATGETIPATKNSGTRAKKEQKQAMQKQEKKQTERGNVIERCTHIYTYPNGNEQYRKERVKYENGEKNFFFSYVEDGKTIRKKPANANCLYNLSGLEAANDNTRLYIVEGEKCADALIKNGLLATTSNAGAKSSIKFTGTDLKYLKKFNDVVLIPDNDGKGKEYISAFPIPLKVLELTKIWDGCPHKGDIVNYLEAGQPIDKIKNYVFSADEKIYPMDKKKGNVANFPPGLPISPLYVGKWIGKIDGVYLEGREDITEITSTPIAPVEIWEDVETHAKKVTIAYFSDNAWNFHTVSRSQISERNKIILLSDLGIDVTSGNAAKLVEYIRNVQKLNSLPVKKCISRFGWYEGVFVPYEDGLEANVDAKLLQAITSEGNLQDWIDFVGAKRSQSMQFRIALAASFASPLVDIVNVPSFILHLHGESGCGKTISQMLAASIWGKPSIGDGLIYSLRSTGNSLKATCKGLYNIPFFGDELQGLKDEVKNFSGLIYELCNGVERMRLKTDGTHQKAGAWKNIFFFTGEEPILSDSDGAGVFNRVLEYECQQREKITLETGQEIANFLQEHYGTAGKKFIESLPTKEKIRELYNNNVKSIEKKLNTTDKQIAAVALVYTADTLATAALFSDYDNMQPIPFSVLGMMVKSNEYISTARRAYDFIISLINENPQYFDETNKFSKVWGKFKNDGTMLFSKVILVKELSKGGFNFDAIKKDWAKLGYLIKNSQGRYYEYTTVSCTKEMYVRLKASR